MSKALDHYRAQYLAGYRAERKRQGRALSANPAIAHRAQRAAPPAPPLWLYAWRGAQLGTLAALLWHMTMR